MEMQCDLLVSNSKDPKTMALVKENIGRISDGSSPHCAGALKLGLRKVYELKRKQFVLLRCSASGCAWHTNHISSSTAGSNTLCQNCLDHGWGNRYLQCVGCGYNRTSACASCQSCKKRFL